MALRVLGACGVDGEVWSLGFGVSGFGLGISGVGKARRETYYCTLCLAWSENLSPDSA